MRHSATGWRSLQTPDRDRRRPNRGNSTRAVWLGVQIASRTPRTCRPHRYVSVPISRSRGRLRQKPPKCDADGSQRVGAGERIISCRPVQLGYHSEHELADPREHDQCRFRFDSAALYRVRVTTSNELGFRTLSTSGALARSAFLLRRQLHHGAHLRARGASRHPPQERLPRSSPTAPRIPMRPLRVQPPS